MAGGPLNSRSTSESSRQTVANRLRVGLLRQLTAAPLSEWPDALVRCLHSLSTAGVCLRPIPGELLPPVADSHGPLANDPVSASSNVVPDSAGVSTRRSARPSPHVRWIRAYIRAHYGETISVTALATRVGRNDAYVATLFRRQTGTTIHRYLTRVRMRHAAALLRRSEKVEAVMLLVGYRSKKNFYRQFETTFGITPGSYRAANSRPLLER